MASLLPSSRAAKPCVGTPRDAHLPVKTVPVALRRTSCPASRSTPASSSSEPSRGAFVCRAAAAPMAGAMPIVKIDNISDPFATVLSVEFGNSPIGELLDAVTALKNLGLNIRSAKVGQKSGAKNVNTFYITDADTSEKIVRSARLEDIRMTVINSLISKFPEVSEAMAGSRGSISDVESNKILGTHRKVVQTTIDVSEAPNGSCSLLKITTRDRPGLLVDIVRVLKDINLNVVSAEIDTEGITAKDEFFLTYHGEPLTSPMVLLVTNALQYYLSLGEVAREESY